MPSLPRCTIIRRAPFEQGLLRHAVVRQCLLQQNEGKVRTLSEPLENLRDLSATRPCNSRLEAALHGSVPDIPDGLKTRHSRLTRRRTGDSPHCDAPDNDSPRPVADSNARSVSLEEASLRPTQAHPEAGERPNGGRCPRRGDRSGRTPRGEESPRSPRRLAGGRDSRRRCPTTVRGLSLVIGYPVIRETSIE